MGKKLPHTLDTEDLLNLIEKAPEKEENPGELPEVLEYVNDVLPFLSSFNIQQGEERVRRTVLFTIYKAWSIDPLTRKEFLLEADRYLPKNQTNTHYSINKNAIKLTHDVYVKFSDPYRRLKSKTYTQHFQDFLDYHAIKPGEVWLNLDILYFIYDKYKHKLKLLKNQSINKKTFGKFCELHFRVKFTRRGRKFAVSENIKNFFQPGQLERMIKTYGNRQKEYNKETKVKKRKTKVSRARSKVQPKD